MPDIWKGTKRIRTRSENGVVQEREMLCLTEQGLYFFLGRSDKPKAPPYGIQLKAAELERLLTPTEIGKELGESARLVNALLLEMSYQRKVVNGYEPIGDGKTYGVMLDVGKSHSDGTPVRQLKWKSSIIDVLRQEIS